MDTRNKGRRPIIYAVVLEALLLSSGLMIYLGSTPQSANSHSIRTTDRAIRTNANTNFKSLSETNAIFKNSSSFLKVRAPRLLLQALISIFSHKGKHYLFEKQVKINVFENSFLMTIKGSQDYVFGIKSYTSNSSYLLYHTNPGRMLIQVTGLNGHNYKVTSPSDQIIGSLIKKPVNLTDSLTVLLAFNDIYQTAKKFVPSISTKTKSDAPTPCQICGGNYYQYTNQTDFKAVNSTTGVTVTNDIISLQLDYNSNGIVGGVISVNAKYDVSYYSPFFSAVESVTDTLGFSWYAPLPGSGSSFNDTSYTHQDTQLTYNIQLTFGPYYTTCYYFFTCEYYIVLSMGTHMNVPQLS